MGSRPRTRGHTGCRKAFLPVIAAGLFVTPAAVAQGPSSAAPPTREYDSEDGGDAAATDAYGNAQPILPERRAVGAYQNDTQRDSQRGYQTLGRGFSLPGGKTPFALPGDFLDDPVGGGLPANFVIPGIPRAAGTQRRAFGLYGGFSRRSQPLDREGVSAVLSRRYSLMAATAMNAPVYRAMANVGSMAALRSSIDRTPFVPSEVDGQRSIPATLEQRLDTQVAVSHLRARLDAWAFFRDGEYRRAARVFESATMLEPGDPESRIGELFCHLAIGAVRTSMVLLRTLSERDANPFIHDLKIGERFGNMADAQQLRIQAQVQVEAAEVSPDARALFVFVLWHLDQTDDATRAAAALARSLPGSHAYAAWPDKMRAAKAARSAASVLPIRD